MSPTRPVVGRELTLLEGRFAISQLPPADPIPAWAAAGSWVSITRTRRELSIVSEESGVPEGVRSETGWRVFEVAGPVPFTETGVLAELLAPLAAAGISVFALSTFRTDYLLVRDSDLDRAVAALSEIGHPIARKRGTSAEDDPTRPSAIR